jgi:hypothetical protein
MQPSIFVDSHSPDIRVYPTLSGTYASNHLVWVQTGRGTPLEGAEIRWRLQGTASASGTAVSNALGTAYINLALGPTTRAVCVDFIIESISKPGFHYEAEAPVVRSYCPALVTAGRPAITFTRTGNVTVATASVTVTDQRGNPAPGVVLTGEWGGEPSTLSATTGSTGVATFIIARNESGCELFFLRSLSKPGHASAPIASPSAVGCASGSDVVVTPAAMTVQ